MKKVGSCRNEEGLVGFHQFERVGYRVGDDAGPASAWLAVLVCLRCGKEVTTPVHYTRDYNDTRGAR